MTGDKKPSYPSLTDSILAWAQKDSNIRALVVIGSRARTDDHPADEWSDLDLLVVATDPKPLWEGIDWLREIGTPWITFVEPTPGDGGYERRVLFEGGLDVDFAPVAAAEIRAWAGGQFPPVIADILRRGARVILDKDGLLDGIREWRLPPADAPHPSEAEFTNHVNDFWYHAVWTAKKARRGELWTAISCCNMYMKNLMRQMIEWHAHAMRGGELDTWMRGRFLEEWADPKAVAALPGVFARCDSEDIRRALRATMDVFHDLAAETAGKLGYPYPYFTEEKARGVVAELIAGRAHPQAKD